ncbi:MAG: serine/threonine-protein kinase [Streptosporangiaceae bacterium]
MALSAAWLGTYRIITTLGIGGFGEVFLARRADGRPVAIKALLRVTDAQRALFVKEVRNLRRVAPAYVAEPLDFDFDHNPPYLVSRYFPDSLTLDDHVRLHGVMSGRALPAFAAELATIVAAIDDTGLVHRDLKPSNVLVTEYHGLRTIDFGIARQHDTVDPAESGTPAYRAPEQYTGWGIADHRTDMWGWARTVVYAATGVHMGRRSVLPEPLRTLVGRCVATNQNRRPTARQVLRALRVPDYPEIDGNAAYTEGIERLRAGLDSFDRLAQAYRQEPERAEVRLAYAHALADLADERVVEAHRLAPEDEQVTIAYVRHLFKVTPQEEGDPVPAAPYRAFGLAKDDPQVRHSHLQALLLTLDPVKIREALVLDPEADSIVIAYCNELGSARYQATLRHFLIKSAVLPEDTVERIRWFLRFVIPLMEELSRWGLSEQTVRDLRVDLIRGLPSLANTESTRRFLAEYGRRLDRRGLTRIADIVLLAEDGPQAVRSCAVAFLGGSPIIRLRAEDRRTLVRYAELLTRPTTSTATFEHLRERYDRLEPMNTPLLWQLVSDQLVSERLHRADTVPYADVVAVALELDRDAEVPFEPSPARSHTTAP